MSVNAGTRLGPYEILSAVGAGGMGEVYRARDTRLDRIVAIKILPDHLADRAELRDRFEHEAKTISSLNLWSPSRLICPTSIVGLYHLLLTVKPQRPLPVVTG